MSSSPCQKWKQRERLFSLKSNLSIAFWGRQFFTHWKYSGICNIIASRNESVVFCIQNVFVCRKCFVTLLLLLLGAIFHHSILLSLACTLTHERATEAMKHSLKMSRRIRKNYTICWTRGEGTRKKSRRIIIWMCTKLGYWSVVKVCRARV